MRLCSHHIVLLVTLSVMGACASCTTHENSLASPEQLEGSQVPEGLLTLMKEQVAGKRSRLTVVILLECSDCSSLAAIPLTKADPKKASPILILPAGESAYASRAKKMNPFMPVICPTAPLGLTTDQISVGSFVAQIDWEGEILNCASLTNFADLAAIQDWSNS